MFCPYSVTAVDFIGSLGTRLHHYIEMVNCKIADIAARKLEIKRDRTPKGSLNYLLYNGFIRDFVRGLTLYGFDPKPCIKPEVQKTCTQFLQLYEDMVVREKNGDDPDEDMIKLFKEIQDSICYTNRDDEDEGNSAVTKIKSAYQSMKSISSNLEVVAKTKRVPIGSLGLCFICFSAMMCTKYIDIKGEPDENFIVTEFVGNKSGERTDRYNDIKMRSKNWDFDSFAPFDSRGAIYGMNKMMMYVYGINFRKTLPKQSWPKRIVDRVGLLRKTFDGDYPWTLDVIKERDAAGNVIEVKKGLAAIRQEHVDRAASAMGAMDRYISVGDTKSALGFWDAIGREAFQSLQSCTTVGKSLGGRKKLTEEQQTKMQAAFLKEEDKMMHEYE